MAKDGQIKALRKVKASQVPMELENKGKILSMIPYRGPPQSRGGAAQSQRGSQYGGGSTEQAGTALQKVQQRLKGRGANGFIGLQRRFKIMDDDRSGNIDMNEFKKSIKELKVDITSSETEDLFRAFDRDGSGAIDYDEFLRSLPHASPMRNENDFINNYQNLKR